MAFLGAMARPPRPPRLAVSEHEDPIVTSVLSGRDSGQSPEVYVKVEWDLGAEEQALAELERVVAKVRGRIEVARRG